MLIIVGYHSYVPPQVAFWIAMQMMSIDKSSEPTAKAALLKLKREEQVG